MAKITTDLKAQQALNLNRPQEKRFTLFIKQKFLLMKLYFLPIFIPVFLNSQVYAEIKDPVKVETNDKSSPCTNSNTDTETPEEDNNEQAKDKQAEESEAEDSNHGFAIGTKIGSLGIGYEATKPLTSMVDIRLGTSQGRANGSLNVTKIHYSAGFDLNTVMASIDVHPTHSGFYLNGGAVINHNKIVLSNKPNKVHSIKVGDVTVDSGKINADISFGSISPYAGIGYRSPIAKEKGLTFTSELGLLYQGKPKVDLTVSSLEDTDPNIAKEANSMQKDLASIRYWPVVSLGLAYNF